MAGVYLRFHDLRHTFATRMANAGVDIFTLAELSGHSDIRIARRYAHGTEETKRRAVKKLVKDKNPRASNATKKKGKLLACPNSFYGASEGTRTLDLRFTKASK